MGVTEVAVFVLVFAVIYLGIGIHTTWGNRFRVAAIVKNKDKPGAPHLRMSLPFSPWESRCFGLWRGTDLRPGGDRHPGGRDRIMIDTLLITYAPLKPDYGLDLSQAQNVEVPVSVIRELGSVEQAFTRHTGIPVSQIVDYDGQEAAEIFDEREEDL